MNSLMITAVHGFYLRSTMFENLKNLLFDYTAYHPLNADVLTPYAQEIIDRINNLNINFDDLQNNFYDFIVVGGGSAGTAVSERLALQGQKVLVIERGVDRSDPRASNARNIYGAGSCINDRRITMPVVTSQGYISHYANGVVGGGSAVNMGINLFDSDQYWNFLRSEFGWEIDLGVVASAKMWLMERQAAAMPQDTKFAEFYAMGLEQNYGPREKENLPFGNSDFRPNSSWQGSTLFKSEEMFFRQSNDVLLTSPDLLTETEVFNVLFSADKVAECVSMTKLNAPPPNTVVGVPSTLLKTNVWLAPLKQLLDRIIFSKVKQVLQFLTQDRPVQKDLCVRKGGKIILSTGALTTPVILANSGIVSSKYKSAGALVQNDMIGRDATDRVFIPIGYFMKKDTDTPSKPRIIESAGFWSPYKNDPANECLREPFEWLYDDSREKCVFAGIESLGGGDIILGTTLATRFLVPPSFRNHAITDLLISLVDKCLTNVPIFGLMKLNDVICPNLQPSIDCIRRLRSNFYVQSQPVGRHELNLGRDEHNHFRLASIDSNYINQKDDIDNAIDGMRKVLENVPFIAASQNVEPFLQEDEPSCPFVLLGGLDILGQRLFELFLMVNAAGKSLALIDPGHSEFVMLKKLALAQEDSQFSEMMNSVMRANNFFSKFSDILSNDWAENDYRNIINSNLNSTSILGSKEVSQRLLSARPLATKPLRRVLAMFQTFFSLKVGDQNYDTFEEVRGRRSWMDERSLVELGVDLLFDDAEFLSYWDIDSAEDSFEYEGQGMKPLPEISTFPPIIPKADAPRKKLLHFTQSLASSIWHWAGSVQAGEGVEYPVDSKDFSVRGVTGLHVVDASVINVLPRLNPNATVSILGYMAAENLINK